MSDDKIKPEPLPQPETVCPHCGNREAFHIENDSSSGDPLFSDLHCSRCGAFVRIWNSV